MMREQFITEQGKVTIDLERLTEDELAEVAGGKGCWDQGFEDRWLERYRRFEEHRGKWDDFEQYLAAKMARNANGADMLEARSWWIAFERPADTMYIVYDDGSFKAFPH